MNIEEQRDKWFALTAAVDAERMVSGCGPHIFPLEDMQHPVLVGHGAHVHPGKNSLIGIKT